MVVQSTKFYIFYLLSSIITRITHKIFTNCQEKTLLRSHKGQKNDKIQKFGPANDPDSEIEKQLER